MSEALSVLIVSEERGRASRWAAWLARRGFVSLWCVGPQVNEDCPRLDGRTCGRRELFDLALIDLTELPALEWQSAWPQRFCVKARDDRRSVFVVRPGVSPSPPLPGLTVTGPVTEHELARAMHRIARDPRKPRIPGRKGSAAAPTTPRPPSVRPLV